MFSQPKVELEQYPTGAHIASRMLYTVGRRASEQPPRPRSAAAAARRRGPMCHLFPLAAAPPQIESMYNDLEGKTVVDLGCGTVRGRLPSPLRARPCQAARAHAWAGLAWPGAGHTPTPARPLPRRACCRLAPRCWAAAR